MFFLDITDQIDAVAIRQAHVGQAQVKFELFEQLVRLLDILCRARLEIHAPKGEFQKFADVGLVIHDQDLIFAHNVPTASSAHSSARTKVTRKRLPIPLSPGKGSSRAPLLSHSSLAMYRPRPVPLGVVVKNGSKILSTISAGMPLPQSIVSRKGRLALSRPVLKAISACPANAGLWRRAFWQRLPMTC